MFGSKKDKIVLPADRFEEVNFTKNTFATHYVVKDKMTGVLYYMAQANGNGGIGLTPLLNPDGTLIVEPVE